MKYETHRYSYHSATRGLDFTVETESRESRMLRTGLVDCEACRNKSALAAMDCEACGGAGMVKMTPTTTKG